MPLVQKLNNQNLNKTNNKSQNQNLFLDHFCIFHALKQINPVLFIKLFQQSLLRNNKNKATYNKSELRSSWSNY